MIFSERYRQDGNLWMPNEEHNFQYSDGDENENYILNAIQQSTDLSIGSEELAAYIKDWPSLYHLSPQRADLLRPFAEQLKTKKILEIGSGCGAITRFLGEMNCDVLALEGSPRRARITLERCRGLDNVKVVTDNFEVFVIEEKFDCITLIGVLEYSNLFIKGDNPPLAMLKRVKQLLKPGGYIIIAIENKLGLKYWTGAPEDHVSKIYHGIQDLYSNAGPETFGHSEMISLLGQAGFGISEFMYPFPDYKFADIIITEAGFKKQGFDPLGLLVEKFEYFQNTTYDSQFSSTLTAHSLFDNKVLPYFANSFLITATLPQAVRSSEENQALAYAYNTSRKKIYCKQTTFSSDSESESVSVSRKLLYENDGKNQPYLQHLLQDEPYVNGQILFGTLLPIVSASGWSTEDIIRWARPFYDFLISKSFQKDQQTWLAGNYLDLAPFNIILANGEPHSFDLEWVSYEDIPAYYIFFRGIAHCLGRIFFVSNPKPGTPLQIMQLAIEVARHYFSFDDAELLDCQTREIKYFSMIALREIPEPFATTQLKVRGSGYLQLLESNKELLLQHEKLLNELREKQEQLNARLQEISLLKRDIQWYIDTYVNRSLFGTLKEKLKPWKKKINFNKKKDLISSKVIAIDYIKDPEQADTPEGKARKNTYYLNPAKNITSPSDSGEYTSVGDDPFFIVDFKEKRLKAGWYWLSIDIAELKGILLAPKLYYDYGRGFNEEDVWNLPGSSNGKIDCLIKFPYDIVRLRFDPTTTECTFNIKKLHLRRVGKMKAFQLGMSKYKQLHCPDKSNLSFYASLTASVLTTGKAELRRKFWDSITSKSENSFDDYKRWCALYDTVLPTQYEKIRLLAESLTYQPLLSIIVPVYNAPVDLLKKAIESVRNQAYKNWELCIADDNSTNEDVRKLLKEYQVKDSRIKVVFRETNGHISAASNSALGLAIGDYAVLLDQDDELPVHCLYMVAATINKNRDIGIIYSDEDKIDEKGNRFDPYFKTDWNKDLFYGQNMINHLGVYKLSLIRKIGGFRIGFEGSQDYDMALRCIEHLKPEQIHHIPHVLYHWRAVKGSTAVTVANKNYAIDAGLRALRDHFKRTRQNATPERNVNNSYRIKWALPENEPLVSIIIPTKDKIDILSTCVSSILQKTSYINFEVIIIDNNSEDTLTLAYFEQIQREHKQIKVYPYNGEFNFSAINNYGVQQSHGEVLVLLNNDTSVINNDWLSEMVSLCLREEIGAVGAKLFYPNGQIQHAGVFLYEGNPGNHIYLKRDSNDPGYFNKLNLVQNYSAVTAACLVVRRDLYIKAGGLDDQNLKVAYNDVDFCLKVRDLGYRNAWTPFAQLIHYESLSRGSDLNEINLSRFKKEQRYMLTKWKNAMLNDPFFNPNLAIETSTTQFSFPPKIEYEWQKETKNEHKKQSVEL